MALAGPVPEKRRKAVIISNGNDLSPQEATEGRGLTGSGLGISETPAKTSATTNVTASYFSEFGSDVFFGEC